MKTENTTVEEIEPKDYFEDLKDSKQIGFN